MPKLTLAAVCAIVVLFVGVAFICLSPTPSGPPVLSPVSAPPAALSGNVPSPLPASSAAMGDEPEPLAEPIIREVAPGVFEAVANQVHVAHLAPPPRPLAPGEAPLPSVGPPVFERPKRTQRPPAPPADRVRMADENTLILK